MDVRILLTNNTTWETTINIRWMIGDWGSVASTSPCVHSVLRNAMVGLCSSAQQVVSAKARDWYSPFLEKPHHHWWGIWQPSQQSRIKLEKQITQKVSQQSPPWANYTIIPVQLPFNAELLRQWTLLTKRCSHSHGKLWQFHSCWKDESIWDHASHQPFLVEL